MNLRPWVLILILLLGNQSYCQWVKTECPERVGAFAIIDNNIFIETSDRIFLSTDEGHSWKTADSGITSQHVHSLAVSGNNIFAGTSSGVFLSTDNGTSWTAINAGFADSEIMSLTVSGSAIYVGTVDSGFFYSINNGSSWTQFDFALMGFMVSFFAVSNNTMYAGGYSICSACIPDFSMFCSTDHGLSWRLDTVFTTYSASSLVVDCDHFFAGTYGAGVLLSTDNGKKWFPQNTGLTDINVRALALKGGTIFAGTLTGGVFISSNSGKQWTSGGLENSDIRLLAVSDKHVFAVTNTQGVWQRPLSEITGSVKPDPKRNMLNQLPFKITSINRNGTKVAIEFSIPNQENVSIKLFDPSGRQLSSIVNRHAEAGSFHYRMDKQVRGSGCYVVILESGAISSMRLIHIVN